MGEENKVNIKVSIDKPDNRGRKQVMKQILEIILKGKK